MLKNSIGYKTAFFCFAAAFKKAYTNKNPIGSSGNL